MEKRRKTERLVTVKDAWGKRYRVPRSFYPTPPPNATVIRLIGKNSDRMISALARAVGKETDLAAGGFTFRDGDLVNIARIAGLFRLTERPRQSAKLRAQRERIKERTRKLRQQAGEKKSGRLMPQTVLIHATAQALKAAGHHCNAVTVLAVLTHQHPQSGELLCTIDDLVEPIELRDDEPPVEVDEGKVFFRFKNRPNRCMTFGRFKNAVSDAARTRS